MSEPIMSTLGEFVMSEREAIMAEWRARVRMLDSAHGLDTPTLNDHIGGLLDAISASLAGQHTPASASLETASTSHGMQRRWIGFDIVEVVAEYKVMRSVLQEFCGSRDVGPKSMPIVNEVIDDAIALAVHSYAVEQIAELERYRSERAAFVTHDLRTPLAAIQTAALGLERSMETPAPELKLVSIIRRNTSRLYSLITRFLEEQTTPAASPNLKPRELDLWPLVEALIVDVSTLATAAKTSIVNAVDEDVVVVADPVLVTQVFQNLLSNALKYTHGGQVEVAASLLENQWVECLVRDTGRGIAEDRVAKIFEKFETDGEGTGLGLAIVKQAVEAHGGTISVESQLGQGTLFRFTLPGVVSRPPPA
jgi:signal transduction histidine kinase